MIGHQIQFVESFNNQTPVEKALEFEKNLKALTAKDIQNAANKFLTKNRIISVLKPETAK